MRMISIQRDLRAKQRLIPCTLARFYRSSHRQHATVVVSSVLGLGSTVDVQD